MTVTQTGSTNTNVTLTWVLEYVAHGFAFYIGSRSYSVTIAGSTVGSGSFAASGITGTAEIARGTRTINKTTSKQWISFSASFAFNGTWNGVYGGTKSTSGSIEVAAKPSYTISYNANGGSGAPSSQTKWYGANLTLSSSKPTRTGYSFLGWSTSSSATSATYAPSGTYSANASATLYAVWKANTYTVKYNANGGTGAPANQTKTYGKTLTLSSTKPTRTNYNFKGWGTSASATTVAYASGSSYTANAAITLYAIWELAYTAPRISNPSADRCTSSGTLSEDGTYALVKFSWACDKTVTSIKIEYKLSSLTSYTSVTVAATGTSGTVSKVIGGSMDTEYLYNVRVTVTDSMGNSTYSTDVPAMAYIIDVLSGGGGVAFGKPAEQKGMDIAMDAVLRKGHTFKRELSDGTLVDLLYPVGSVYMSVSSTNPGNIFGGSWTQITGRFLYCTTNSKQTGGSNTINLSHTHTTAGHKLTVSEMPSHNHKRNTTAIIPKADNSGSGYGMSNWSTWNGLKSLSYKDGQTNSEVWDKYGYGTFTVNSTGGSASHSHGKTGSALSNTTNNNMPAYFTVYCWYRTA